MSRAGPAMITAVRLPSLWASRAAAWRRIAQGWDREASYAGSAKSKWICLLPWLRGLAADEGMPCAWLVADTLRPARAEGHVMQLIGQARPPARRASGALTREAVIVVTSVPVTQTVVESAVKPGSASRQRRELTGTSRHTAIRWERAKFALSLSVHRTLMFPRPCSATIALSHTRSSAPPVKR